MFDKYIVKYTKSVIKVLQGKTIIILTDIDIF